MALKPYSPIENSRPTRVRSQSNGTFAIRDAAYKGSFTIFLAICVFLTDLSGITFMIVELVTKFTFNIYRLFQLLFWNTILYLIYLVARGESMLKWNTILKTKNTKLILKSSILKRGDITEFSFFRELRWNKSLPIMGTLYWRVSCSEVTRTGTGTSSSYTHHTLWTEDLSPTSLSAGAIAIQGSNWVVLPNHLPATLPARGGNNQAYIESWIEWQVQISSQITDFDLSDSRFVLTVE